MSSDPPLARIVPEARIGAMEKLIARVLLVAMVVLLPWPFYLVAVLSVTSIPLMVVVALAPFFHGYFLMIAFAILILLQASLGVWVFWRIARSFARRVAGSAFAIPFLAVALLALVAVSFLPIYGGGEN